ncbi:MAG TPA: STAS domain-containing protein [Bryobacteraceae bacterium]|nr:STAS domain-containing protein [Bryobacteraceae bacterium]
MSFVPLDIEQREKDGIVILDLKGRITLGAEDSRLHQCLENLLQAGRRNVILNLREVSVIDHAAVGLLVMCAEAFQKARGRIALLNGVGDQVAADDVLKLDTEVPTYTEEQDAVNSFFPERSVPQYDLLAFLEEINEGDRDQEPQHELKDDAETHSGKR